MSLSGLAVKHQFDLSTSGLLRCSFPTTRAGSDTSWRARRGPTARRWAEAGRVLRQRRRVRRLFKPLMKIPRWVASVRKTHFEGHATLAAFWRTEKL